MRTREFGGLLVARVLSDIGNYVARIAVAALVLSESGSVLLSAVVFAIAVAPSVVGDALLGPLADRLPRVSLMVGCDLVRAVLVGVLVLAVQADAPLVGVLALLFLVELAGTPFASAHAALIADILPEPEDYLVGNATVRVVELVNQVLGLALGGLALAVLQVSGALWFDAGTFVVSALLLGVCLTRRPAAAGGSSVTVRQLLADVREGWDYLRGHREMRSLMLLAWSLSVTLGAPVGLGIAYAVEQGDSESAGSLLLATEALGAAVGATLVTRWPHPDQVRRMLPMAAACSAVLMLAGIGLGWPVSGLVWVAVGALSGFMMPLLSTFTLLSPARMRGRLNGLAGSGFALASVVGFVVAGGLADLTSAAFSLLCCGALGCVVVALAWPRWPRRELVGAALGTSGLPGRQAT